jgi:parallel beta-helix repeat protein
MLRVFTIILSMMFLTVGMAFAVVINIPGDYATIQAGINASADGDTVMVATGNYSEQFDFSGKGITVLSAAGPNLTFLDPPRAGQSIVKFITRETRNARIEGFAIQNTVNAPAIFISGSQPTITGNIFLHNTNSEHGGAIMSMSGFPYIANNLFEYNVSNNLGGGAIFSYEGNVIISQNAFFYNTAPYHHGGAIHIFIANKSVIDHNLFYRNSCLALGGAFLFSVCTACVAYNNTIVENTDIEEHGAGLAVWYSDNCRVFNNIIVDNTGIGLYSYPPNHSTATYNDIWTNTENYRGIDPGEGSISVNPDFDCQPPSFGLASGSPCIDAGDPSGPYDPDGTIADLGAFYFDMTDVRAGWTAITAGIGLGQNYPNPFNAQTTISFSIPERSPARISIYDLLGRKIDVLIDGMQEVGEHKVVWDAIGLPSDVYLARFEVSGRNQTIPMLLLK